MVTDGTASGSTAGYIKVIVVRRDQGEIHFRVKLDTTMGKLRKCYADRAGVAISTVRFLVNGKRVTDKDTPQALELEEDAVIKVY